MKTLWASLRMLLVMTVFCGLIYPLAFTGAMQSLFPYEANGSIIEKEGKIIGSELIGQEFKGPGYFMGRPSANEYAADNSAGTNWGAINKDLKAQVQERAAALREQYGLKESEPVPSVLVTNSTCGFDPHLTPESLHFQAKRVAAERGLPLVKVKELIDQHTEEPAWGFIGEARVNVLKLNLALDALK